MRRHLAQHRLWSLANDHKPLAAGNAQPSLGVRTPSAAPGIAASPAGVDTASSYEEEGRLGSPALSKDLLVHLRQTLRCLMRAHLAAAHRA